MKKSKSKTKGSGSKKKKKPLTAMTLCAKRGGEPAVTLVMGHVKPRTFELAMRREGWDKGDLPTGLRHEYWWEDSKKMWAKTTKKDPKAVPVTVMDW